MFNKVITRYISSELIEIFNLPNYEKCQRCLRKTLTDLLSILNDPEWIRFTVDFVIYFRLWLWKRKHTS